MIINENFILAEPGKTIQRIYDEKFVGISYCLGYVYYKNGVKLDTPYLETVDDFRELTLEETKEFLNYGELVDRYIREKYTISDELAINRQRETKPEAFQEYFDYCEECKRKAYYELGLNNIEFTS